MDATGSSETDPNAKVLTRQSNSTYVAAVAAVLGVISAGAASLIGAFKIDDKTTVPQAVVIVGGCLLTAFALLSLAIVMAADFRTRSITKTATVGVGSTNLVTDNGSESSLEKLKPLLRVWAKDNAKLPVLTVRWDSNLAKTMYFVVVAGSAAPIWLSEDEITGYEGNIPAIG